MVSGDFSVMCIALVHKLATLLEWGLGVESGLAGASVDMIGKTEKTINIVGWVVVIVVGLLAAIFLALKIRNELGRGGPSVPAPEAAPSAMDSALRSERKGDFIKAAMNYEALGDSVKAAELYEKGRQFTKAASLYEKSGDPDRAVTMYKRAGESLKAASVYMKMKNYAEAAKIFKNKGDTLRAAQAFEMMGNKMAAAREYTSSGQYLRAAKMYKDERMYTEAGEVYGMALAGEPVAPSNLGKYYTYAAFLVMSEDLRRAGDIYKKIAKIDASFKDVQEKVRLIGLRTGQIREPELAIDKVARQQAEHEEVSEVAGIASVAEPGASRPEEFVAQGQEHHQAEYAAGPDDVVSKPGPLQSEQPHSAEGDAEGSESLAEGSQEESKPPVVDTSTHDATLAELSIPDVPSVARSMPEPGPVESPQGSVPSASVRDSSPSVEASSEAIAEKVIQQDEVDDLFDQMGGAEDEAGGDAMRRETTLRSIMNSGRMEPKYSMRMWMQILKQLYEKHSSGTYYGCIPPESIHIDMENNVRLDPPGRQVAEYTAPEVINGSPPSEQTDIYSMGVILYEMTTGSTETLGKKYPIDIYDDIPEWMDEMIMRCIERDRSARFRGLDDISSLVMQRAASE